jgi:hypothetical protein
MKATYINKQRVAEIEAERGIDGLPKSRGEAAVGRDQIAPREGVPFIGSSTGSNGTAQGGG